MGMCAASASWREGRKEFCQLGGEAACAVGRLGAEECGGDQPGSLCGSGGAVSASLPRAGWDLPSAGRVSGRGGLLWGGEGRWQIMLEHGGRTGEEFQRSWGKLRLVVG